MFVNFYGKCATGDGVGVESGRNFSLTISLYRGGMIRRRKSQRKVTLVLPLEDGLEWPLRLSEDCVRFIGRYRRIENFGPPSGLLHFLPGHIA